MIYQRRHNEDTIATEVPLFEIAPAEILCYASDVH